MTRTPLEQALIAGAIVALRKGADAQRKLAGEGTFEAGPKFPGVEIRSPEAAGAARLSNDWASIADELEAGMLS